MRPMISPKAASTARALARAWDQFAYYEVSPDTVTVRDADSDVVLV